jgi:probable O-glycosylation ligase (exosortase A-associated)
MREALLTIVTVVLCAAALANPGLGLYGYIAYIIMRPDVMSYSRFPFIFAVSLCTLVGTLRLYAQFINIFRSPITLGILLLQVPIGLSIVYAVRPELCWNRYDIYYKVIIMSLLVPVIVINEKTLHRLLLVITLSLGYISVKFSIFSILHGGVILQSMGYQGIGMLSDNNGLALAIGMLMPIAWYLRLRTENKYLKLALIGIAGSSLFTVISTNSRGNAVAMACVILMLIARSRRQVWALVGIAVLALPAVLLVGDRFAARMGTIENVDADASAASRTEFASAAVRMWQDYTLTGVGFGQDNYVLLSEQYLGHPNPQGLVVHNTYLQVLVDSGIGAFALHVLLLLGTTLWLGRSASKMKRFRPELAVYPYALQGALAHFAIGSTFYSRESFELYYILLTAAAAWQLIARQVYASHDPVEGAVPDVADVTVRALG